jgi:hypothetical protein
MRNFVKDAQQAMGFLVSQVSYIEAEVYRIQYPDVQYPALIPVDSSAPEWAKSVTYYSLDKAGQANWFHHSATDLPLADVQRSKFEQGIEMAGIGYRYTLEELGQAMMIPGMNLTTERAEAARRAYEEFVDDKALRGDTTKGFTGLLNADAIVTIAAAAATGTGGSAAWANKTGDQIAADVNDALSGVYTASLTVEMADTVLLPVAEMSRLAGTRMSTTGGTDTNVLEWLRRYNIYSQITGQPLKIVGVRGLENAGVGGDKGRMVVYRRDPQVLKMHIPMPHRFMPVWQTGPITYDIPGIFRLGGLEIRRPGAVRYVDGISDYAS